MRDDSKRDHDLASALQYKLRVSKGAAFEVRAVQRSVALQSVCDIVSRMFTGLLL